MVAVCRLNKLLTEFVKKDEIEDRCGVVGRPLVMMIPYFLLGSLLNYDQDDTNKILSLIHEYLHHHPVRQLQEYNDQSIQ